LGKLSIRIKNHEKEIILNEKKVKNRILGP
jgi:hypothetical protein